MRFLLPVALAAVLMTGPAEAAEMAQFGGLGGSSCGTWTATRHERASGRSWGYEQWILGFLSGVGWEGGGKRDNPLKGVVDLEAVLAWTDNYCQVHSLDRILDAGTAFVAAHPR
jgi:hypothetical protein